MPVTRTGAVEYWNARLGGESFTEETEQRQDAALLSATEAIAPYTIGLDEDTKEAAIYEQANWMLGARYDMQSAGVTSYSVGGISESFQIAGRPLNVAPNAWRILKNGIDGRRGGGPVWL